MKYLNKNRTIWLKLTLIIMFACLFVLGITFMKNIIMKRTVDVGVANETKSEQIVESSSEQVSEFITAEERINQNWENVNKTAQYLGKTPFEIAMFGIDVSYYRVNNSVQWMNFTVDNHYITAILGEANNQLVCTTILYRPTVFNPNLNDLNTLNDLSIQDVENMYGEKYWIDENPVYGQFSINYSFENFNVSINLGNDKRIIDDSYRFIISTNEQMIDIKEILEIESKQTTYLTNESSIINQSKWNGIRTELGYLARPAAEIIKGNFDEWHIGTYKDHLNYGYYKHQASGVYLSIWEDHLCRVICFPTQKLIKSNKKELTNIEFSKLMDVPYVWRNNYYGNDNHLDSLERNVVLKVGDNLEDKSAYIIEMEDGLIIEIMADEDGNVSLDDYTKLTLAYMWR